MSAPSGVRSRRACTPPASVWRSSDPSDEARAWAHLEGLDVAATPRELASTCATVLLAVPDTPEIFEALDGPDGLAGGLRPGTTVVVMSTVSPDTPLELGRRLKAQSVGVVDAPVSGGPEAAAEGALAIMVGGDDADVAAVRPVLAALGSHVVHVGPAGHGELAKLVNNLVGAAIAVATAEGLTLAARAGLDIERTREAIVGGSGGSWILEHWLPATAFRGDYRRRFGIDLMCKDLGLIADLATDSTSTRRRCGSPERRSRKRGSTATGATTSRSLSTAPPSGADPMRSHHGRPEMRRPSWLKWTPVSCFMSHVQPDPRVA